MASASVEPVTRISVPVSSEPSSNRLTKRLSGDTRYATSAKIVEFEFKSNVGFTIDGAYLATGQNFPDALAAGALSGKHLAPLLLVDPGAREACSFLSMFKGEVSRVAFVGGTYVIGNAEAASITRALGVKNA